VYTDSILSSSSPAFVVAYFLDYSKSDKDEVEYQCSFDCTSLMAKDVEHNFHVPSVQFMCPLTDWMACSFDVYFFVCYKIENKI
jgi:hypothetical protein